MTARFRPCIDLHEGAVVQLVGASLDGGGSPVVNFESGKSAADYARLYMEDGLHGGHVIMLGPGNEEAAAAALAAFPGGMHVGGGITPENAANWLERGAGAVVVTSYVFRDGQLHRDNLDRMVAAAGRDRLVVDLSCARAEDGRYVVATDRWRRLTDYTIERDNLEELAVSCSEFLIHATAQEGLQQGIDEDLVRLLGDIAPIPTTYAGGIRSLKDVERVARLGQGRLDYTIGSALDLFGGAGVRYRELITYERGGGHNDRD